MTTTAVPLTNPTFLKDVSLVVGPTAGTNYEFKAALVSAAFTPSSSINTLVGIGGLSISDPSPVTWTCDVTFVQDWETATSLSNYLLANSGTTVDVVFKPRTAGAKTVTAKITLTPGAIGGGAGGAAQATVQMGVVGTPVVA